MFSAKNEALPTPRTIFAESKTHCEGRWCLSTDSCKSSNGVLYHHSPRRNPGPRTCWGRRVRAPRLLYSGLWHSLPTRLMQTPVRSDPQTHREMCPLAKHCATGPYPNTVVSLASKPHRSSTSRFLLLHPSPCIFSVLSATQGGLGLPLGYL